MTDRQNSRDEYLEAVDGLETFGRLVSELLNALMSAERLSFFTTTHRVKTYNSATAKLTKDPARYIDYESIHDMLGVRVITYFSDDVDRVGKLIEREFSVDPNNSVDKRKKLEAQEFGYLSLHYVLSLDPKRAALPEYYTHAGRSFELQIRSTLQHAWAEIEHDLGYKYPLSLPDEARRDFARIASMLESADQDFVRLRNQIMYLERRAVEEVQGRPASPLTPLNALAFVRTNDNALEYEFFLAELLSVELVGGGGYTGTEALAILGACGIDTIERLDAFYRERSAELRNFAELWTRNTLAFNAAVRNELEEGISIFYVELFNLAKLSNQKRVSLIQEHHPVLALPQFDSNFRRVRRMWAT